MVDLVHRIVKPSLSDCASTINILNMIVQHDILTTFYSYRVRICSLVSFHSKKTKDLTTASDSHEISTSSRSNGGLGLLWKS